MLPKRSTLLITLFINCTNNGQAKIIILSMDYSPELILEMTRLGVHGYLSKDIDQALLQDAIRQVTTKGYYTNDEIAQVLRQGLQSMQTPKVSRRINTLNVELTKRELHVLRLICEGLQATTDSHFYPIQNIL